MIDVPVGVDGNAGVGGGAGKGNGDFNSADAPTPGIDGGTVVVVAVAAPPASALPAVCATLADDSRVATAAVVEDAEGVGTSTARG